jgi:hypothetical protein
MAVPNASVYVTSLENIAVSVTAPSAVNPTSYSVEFAFMAVPPPNQPVISQWVTGSWQSTSLPYLALCLVGPDGTIQLTPGQWYVWFKILASPEIPVKYAGILQIS